MSAKGEKHGVIEEEKDRARTQLPMFARTSGARLSCYATVSPLRRKRKVEEPESEGKETRSHKDWPVQT
jgi:hypothetical protein